MSLGIPFIPFFATGGMGHAVDEAYEAGIIMVAAGGQIVDSVCYPAKYSRTIGVGGVTPARRIWFRYGAGKEMIDVWHRPPTCCAPIPLASPGTVPVRPVEGADPGTDLARALCAEVVATVVVSKASDTALAPFAERDWIRVWTTSAAQDHRLP